MPNTIEQDTNTFFPVTEYEKGKTAILSKFDNLDSHFSKPWRLLRSHPRTTKVFLSVSPLVLAYIFRKDLFPITKITAPSETTGLLEKSVDTVTSNHIAAETTTQSEHATELTEASNQPNHEKNKQQKEEKKNDAESSGIIYGIANFFGATAGPIIERLHANTDGQVREYSTLYAPLVSTLYSRGIDIGASVIQLLAINAIQGLLIGESIAAKVQTHNTHAQQYLQEAEPNYQKAAAEYEKIVTLMINNYDIIRNPEEQELFLKHVYEWTTCLFHLGQWHMALQVLIKVNSQMTVCMPEILNLFGMLRLECKQPTLALEHFEKSLGLNHTQTDIVILRAYCDSKHRLDFIRYSFDDLLGKESFSKRTWFLVLYRHAHGLLKYTETGNTQSTIHIYVKAAELLQVAIKEIAKNPAFSDNIACYLECFIETLLKIYRLLSELKSSKDFESPCFDEHIDSVENGHIVKVEPEKLNQEKVIKKVVTYYNKYASFLSPRTAGTLETAYGKLEAFYGKAVEIRNPHPGSLR